jgi:hypothetical protein
MSCLSLAFCDGLGVGHCRRWRWVTQAAGVDSLSAIGYEFRLSGSFPLRRMRTDDPQPTYDRPAVNCLFLGVQRTYGKFEANLLAPASGS